MSISTTTVADSVSTMEVNRDSILYLQGLTAEGIRNQRPENKRSGKLSSDMDSLAIGMTAAVRLLSFPICGVRISQSRA